MWFILLLLLSLVFFLVSAFSFAAPFTLLPAILFFAAAIAERIRPPLRGWLVIMGLALILWLIIVVLAFSAG
ncbi:hypothetical protein [Nitrolancea hollandica]|uniref:Uncharacterized protein n=1 Tax=Nitrolancea hollandica Lb TaxID=1129897 RepID=I4EDR7_9BACT|nr:hypothetical protein [Nitrolancea hollandica]CCF82829.1 exported hypothetical protein [Nitrolancea hollandica Lb]